MVQLVNGNILILIFLLFYDIFSGWVSENSIKPFDVESFATKLLIKKLKTDRNYLDAVCEGIRIQLSSK